jgi:hypothetical protein
MTLYDYLLEIFGTNEPIFSADIQFQNYSKPWIAKELNKLCESENLIRYERGIYYIPTDTPFGKSSLNPYKVIERKYINDGKSINGFYSGMTILNRLGLTTQMPNTLEICTNNETTKVRTVKVGSQQLTLRRARTTVTNKNVDVLRFLELMNFVPSDFWGEERLSLITDYIQTTGINRKAISEYAPYFPDKAMRNLVESEVIYRVAQ